VPFAPPPLTARSTPASHVLPEGTLLWRVHRHTRSPGTFKAVASDGHFGGGRFDSTRDDPYPYLYVALRPETALLETLVRSIPFNEHGARYLRRAALTDLAVSSVRTTKELTLVSLLTGADLAAACQDEWLVTADPAEYAQTRRWGHWLRERADWGQGLIWPSRRDIGSPTAILFGDRVPEAALVPSDELPIRIDDRRGAAWLNRTLAPYRIQVKPPRIQG
jgi:hypothetical protein